MKRAPRLTKRERWEKEKRAALVEAERMPPSKEREKLYNDLTRQLVQRKFRRR
jgi:hypothetical protein